MLIFKPFRSIKNIIPLNARFRALFAAVNELTARIDALEGNSGQHAPLEETETVSADADLQEPAELEPAFDWNTSNSQADLKAFALAQYGLTIKGNKKPETIRAELAAHIEGI